MTLGVFAGAAAPAGAAVTIGQVGDPSASGCSSGYDWVQPTVTAGNSYVIPGNGTITSWTTYASGAPGQQETMKVWRPVAGQDGFYLAVGHTAPETLTPGGVAGNTFPASITVKRGDILGMYTNTGGKCAFSLPGDTYTAASGNTPDGQVGGPFDQGGSDYRLDITAEFVPSSAFGMTGVQRNKKKGTATLRFDLPNAGTLDASGAGAKVAASKSVPAGSANLVVKAKGRKRKQLNETGKAKLKLTVTYTPTGGTPNTTPIKVKLKKKI